MMMIIPPLTRGTPLTEAYLIGHPEQRRRRFAPMVIPFLRIGDTFPWEH